MNKPTGLSPAWTMVLATLLFAGMSLGVKKASAHVSTAEIVFFRGFIGAIIMGALAWGQRIALTTAVPMQHVWRAVAGVSALCLWFYAMGRLPLATAVTLNYMSSVWMAVFLMARQLWRKWHLTPHRAISSAVFWAVMLGFVGVAMVLQPTLARDQWLEGLMGLMSGMLAAWAYLQVVQLGRSGEPEQRVVFYFSCGSALVGLAWMLAMHLLPASVVGTGVGTGADLVQWAWLGDRSTATWGWLLCIGICATAAQLALTRAFAQGQALSMASLQYLGIVHAFVLGIWLFDEPLHGLSVVGAVLIVVAGIAANRASAPLRD